MYAIKNFGMESYVYFVEIKHQLYQLILFLSFLARKGNYCYKI